MVTVDAVRAMALSLRETNERPAPRGGHPQFVTNGKCFAALPQGDASLEVWSEGGWTNMPLDASAEVVVRGALEHAWRQRARKRVVSTLDYEIGAAELSDVFAALRTLPELTETAPGWYEIGGKAFLHFHHSATARHADVKEGLAWGEAIAFPLGRPSTAVQRDFLAEVRRRLEVTLAALAR
jgi:hypothetical protein